MLGEIIKKPAALSQVAYLEKKLGEIEEQIQMQQEIVDGGNHLLMDLFFQKGKLFSELELMKRVPDYD